MSAETTAGDRVLRSVSWNALAMGTAQVATLVRVFATARLLGPDDFGVFAMTMVVFGALAVVTDVGLRPAFIAKRSLSGDERAWLDTVWSGELVVKVGMGLGLALLAYPASLYFEEPQVAWVTAALGLSPALRVLSSPALLHAEREIEFRKLALVDMGAQVAACAVTVGSALLLRSVWALVIGHVSGALIAVLLSYLVAPARPRFRIDLSLFREAFRYGRHLLILSILNFVAARFDNLIIARWLGATALGLYTLSYRFIEIPLGVLNNVVGRVLFPYYAMAKSVGSTELLATFGRSTRYTCWLLLGTLLPLMIFPKLIVDVIMGEKWADAVGILPLLAVVGFLRGIMRLQGTLLQAVGTPQSDVRAMVAEIVVLVATVFAVIEPWQLIGVAAAGVASAFTGVMIRAFMVTKHLQVTRDWAVGVLARPILGGAIAVLASIASSHVTGLPALGLVTFVLVLVGLAFGLEAEARSFAVQRVGSLFDAPP